MPAKAATFNRKKNTKSFHDQCAKLEKKYGCPIEAVYKLLKHTDPEIRLRAATTILNKKVPTPRQIDLSGLMGGSIRGRIMIDIAGDQQVIGQPDLDQIEPAPVEKKTIKRVAVNPSTELTTSPGPLKQIPKSLLSAGLQQKG